MFVECCLCVHDFKRVCSPAATSRGCNADAGREMSVLEITNTINDAAGPSGVRATHALVQSVLTSMENVAFDSARGKAKCV